MKKNLSTLMCSFVIMLPFFTVAQTNTGNSKEGQKNVSKTSTVKPAPSKPVSSKQSAKPTSPANTQKHTPIEFKKPVSQNVHQEQVDRPSKLGSDPSSGTNSTISYSGSNEISKNKGETAISKNISQTAAAKGVNKEAILWNAFLKYKYQNHRNAFHENRHCGCGADIELVNPTNDTIDVFLKYVSSNTLPTIEETAMPEIRRDFLYPTFSVLPGETLTIRGGCNGGILYEATSHFPKTKGKNNNNKILIDPKFIDHGFIRNNCIDKRIVFENEKQ
jgi:hypothetical protein